MDTALELQQTPADTTLSLVQAVSLCIFFTVTTLLGIVHGKHMEKTVSHLEIPNIHYAVKTSRKINE